jgi:hypothetical protein
MPPPVPIVSAAPSTTAPLTATNRAARHDRHVVVLRVGVGGLTGDVLGRAVAIVKPRNVASVPIVAGAAVIAGAAIDRDTERHAAGVLAGTGDAVGGFAIGDHAGKAAATVSEKLV